MLDNKLIGQNIRNRRNELCLTQETIAEIIDISVSFYSHIESGDKSASVKTLKKLSDCLDISIDDILSDKQEREPVCDPLMEKIIYRINKMSEEQKQFILDMIELIDKTKW